MGWRGRGGGRSGIDRSDVFARAAYFTIIDLQNGDVEGITVEENSASRFKQGTGPIVAKMLKEKGVDVVVTGQLGPGAEHLLEMSGIRLVKVTPGTKIKKAIDEAIKQTPEFKIKKTIDEAIKHMSQSHIQS